MKPLSLIFPFFPNYEEKYKENQKKMISLMHQLDPISIQKSR